MNAVDRFSSTYARYNQQLSQYPVAPPPVAQPTPPAQKKRSDLDKALDTVAEVAPVLSRLAVIVGKVQNPQQPAVTSVQTPGYPGYATPPIAPQVGPMGQSLQQIGQAIGGKDVDRFVRSAAPVIDEAIPLIEDIVNLFGGKKKPPQAPPVYQNPTTPPPQQQQIYQPVYQQPGYPQPGYQQPVYQQPGYPQPGYPQPGYQQPVYSQPGYPTQQPTPYGPNGTPSTVQQVATTVQGVASLVSAIGGLFKR